MKILRVIVKTLIGVLIVMILYMNKTTIYSFFVDLMIKQSVVNLKDANEYKRKYDYDKFSNTEDYVPYSSEDLQNIYYNILNNGWDSFSFYCPSEYKTCADDVKIMSANTKLMSNIAGYISPYNSFTYVNTTVASYGEIFVKITKKYSDEDIKNINTKIDSIVKELGINNMESDDKIKTYHDYLISHTIYDDDFAEDNKSIYSATKANGALLQGYAVCGGYSDAMALFLDYINVPNIIISSDTHAWNLVYIDDRWLHLDSTWNDTENKKYNYEFYMITTEQLFRLDTKEHMFPSGFFIETKQKEVN